MCDIRQLVNPSNTENITLITGVPATILMADFMTLNLYILVIKTSKRIDSLLSLSGFSKYFE